MQIVAVNPPAACLPWEVPDTSSRDPPSHLPSPISFISLYTAKYLSMLLFCLEMSTPFTLYCH